MAVNTIRHFFNCASFFGRHIIILPILLSCARKPAIEDGTGVHFSNPDAGKSSIDYAIGFDLVKYDNFDILKLFSHYNEASDTSYYLLKSKSIDTPQQFRDYPHINIPVKRIALLHSSYLSFFEFCDAKEHISSISEAKYVYDDAVYAAVQKGDLPEVGYGASLDNEKLLELGTELVISVGWPNAPNKNQELLSALGIPVLVFSDWQETSLLGRMEWVKVIAALTGKDAQATSGFREAEQAYLELKHMAKSVSDKPSVICNLPYRGSWFVPGGNSYISNLIADAGGTYLWSEDDGTGAIQLDFESVYARGINAAFWINPDFAQSTTDIVDKDERLADFTSLKEGRIYNHMNVIARGVANDYWESGIVNPQVVLKDLIKILHPELVPDHELHYYRQIR